MEAVLKIPQEDPSCPVCHLCQASSCSSKHTSHPAEYLVDFLYIATAAKCDQSCSSQPIPVSCIRISENKLRRAMNSWHTSVKLGGIAKCIGLPASGHRCKGTCYLLTTGYLSLTDLIQVSSSYTWGLSSITTSVLITITSTSTLLVAKLLSCT